jgi:hypothetical protein
MLQIVVRASDGYKMTYPPPLVRIGRSPQVEVVLEESLIARHHCDLQVLDGVLWLADRNSSGGIFLRGQRVSAVALPPDEELRLGHVALRAWLEDVPAPTAAELERARTSLDAEELARLALRGGDWLRAVASGTGTPSSLLGRLAGVPDAITQRAVAANPNAPLEVLQRLALRYPESFWSNPQVDMLLLEDPLLGAFSRYVLCSLLGSPYASEAHLRHFLGHPEESVREFAGRALQARGLPVG